MATLVCCVDRSTDVASRAGVSPPVVGWEAVRSLVTDVGLADPEDANVNCLLEGLRVARDLQDAGEETVVAVVSGGGDSIVGSDRSVADQLDHLVADYDLDRAIVVVDSAEDERVVPIVESRLPVDSVDRVVVRQARDIESTYYLLKQFLGDEELRSTVLVPLGVALLVLPVLALYFPPRVAMAALATLVGAVLLYKGLAIDQYFADAPERLREALYSGQVSVVTYVVAAGLTLVGGFIGFITIPDPGDGVLLVDVMQFAFASVPWLALAALTAATGRLLDELIRDEGIRSPYLNLPFGVVAVGLVLRGFAGYFLEQQGVLDHASAQFNSVTIVLSPAQRLAAFIVAGIVVSLVGVRVAATYTEESLEDVVDDDGVRE